MSGPGSVITIGNFDGVHVGHVALLRRARKAATGSNARVIAAAFDPHPATVLRPGSEPKPLTTFPERSRRLKDAGADDVIRLEPTRELLGMSPAEFVSRVLVPLAPVAIVEGADFRFGRGRTGDIETLRSLGASHGFEVHTVDPVEVVLSDHTVAAASSTLTRWLLGNGRVAEAAAVLGRGYELEGEVVPGDRRGRTIGYPTANLRVECLVPGDGVYAGAGVLPDGRAVPAAISVGTKPTFGEHARTVEAYLLNDPSAATGGSPVDGLPEYGWPLRLRFDAWLRDQLRFDSVDSLLGQMARDCERALDLWTGRARKEIACR